MRFEILSAIIKLSQSRDSNKKETSLELIPNKGATRTIATQKMVTYLFLTN